MRPEERDLAYLLDMLLHVRGIQVSVRGMSLAEYDKDENLRLAVERRLEIIGEAARRISPGFQEKHPEIPWREIVAQRNILAHEYGEIDNAILWQAATTSAPELITLIEPLLPPSLLRETGLA